MFVQIFGFATSVKSILGFPWLSRLAQVEGYLARCTLIYVRKIYRVDKNPPQTLTEIKVAGTTYHLEYTSVVKLSINRQTLHKTGHTGAED